MSTTLLVVLGIVAAGSAIVVALGRELRWSVLAWWTNGIAASLLLLRFDAELLAVLMAVGTTCCGIALFLHADAFGESAAGTGAPLFRPTMILPLAVSGGAGVLLVALLRAVMSGSVEMGGLPSRGRGFSPEEGFVLFQLAALIALAAVLGAGAISRPGRTKGFSGERRDGDG